MNCLENDLHHECDECEFLVTNINFLDAMESRNEKTRPLRYIAIKEFITNVGG